jgi:hypothetical protein
MSFAMNYGESALGVARVDINLSLAKSKASGDFL